MFGERPHHLRSFLAEAFQDLHVLKAEVPTSTGCRIVQMMKLLQNVPDDLSKVLRPSVDGLRGSLLLKIPRANSSIFEVFDSI